MADSVIVYSTPLCAPCEQLKAYLTDKGVAFTVKDLLMDEDAAEFIEGKNIRTSPVLEADGELLFGVNLQPENIDKLLGL